MTRTALITGASSGIGRGAAIRLARDGWHVLAQGRNQDRLQETLEMIAESGGTGESFVAEMGDMEQIEALSDWASDRSGGALGAMVHAAAKFTYGTVSTDRFEDWDRSIDQVLRATIRLTAHLLPAVRNAQGTYIYICGPTSWLGWKNHAIHCALRHAQAGFAKALFEDVREDGIGVTLIHPGFVHTPSADTAGKDTDKMIQVEDVGQLISSTLELPKTACVSEFTVRPQRSPYV